VNTTALELPKDAKERLKALEALSEKAEGGDKSARRELREAVRESAPKIVSRASDIGRRGRWALIKTIAANDPLTEEALVARLDLLRAQVAGPSPSPLEDLLAERVCSLWLLIESLELLVSAQLSRDNSEHRVPMSYLRDVWKWQESASRRYLAALKTLAQVRRLQSGTPSSQTNNVQINL
jgi:hypothetical protein